MQSASEPTHSQLAPHWIAAAGAVSALLGIWLCLSFYKETVAGSAGAGWGFFLIFSPIVFFVALLVLTFPLIWLLGRLESDLARAVVCVVPVGAFLLIQGVPNLFSLGLIGFVAVSIYTDVKRKRTDAQDREAFFDD